MEKWKKRSVDLLTSLYLGSKEEGYSVIPYYPQKTRVSEAEPRFFKRTTPERHRISSKRIYNMLSELESDRRVNVHNLMVLCGDEVIAECSREGYDTTVWHLAHSMSKTVTSFVIGTLFDDGLLTTDIKLSSVFPELSSKDRRFGEITIEHLLTMRSGVDFSEAGAVTEQLWTEAFFASPLKFKPGSEFHYNSMNSYILARVAERLSGRAFGEILRERIFSPLGIENYLWEIGPEGTEKGGWGLYLSAESWAKLGVLVLSGGVFYGRRILSSEWIDLSTRVISESSETKSEYGYGYQIWVAEDGEILFNGMLGQNVWIYPKNNLIAIIQSGNNELFQDSPALKIIRKYLKGRIEDSIHRHDVKALHEKERKFFDLRMWVKPIRREKRILFFPSLKESEKFDKRWTDVLGTYVFARNNIGILPLFVRGMQNNLFSSIERISLSQSGENLVLMVVESGVEYSMNVGFYGYKDAVFDFRGEKYMVRAMGEATHSSSGEREFRIELLFPELPNTRMMKITIPSEGRIRLELSENPNNKVIDELVKRMPGESLLVGFAFGLLARGFGEDFITKRTEEAFSPILIGADVGFEGYRSIVDEENVEAEKKARIGKLLHLFVDRFFGEEEEREGKKRISGRAFLSELFALIRYSDENDKDNKKD